MNCIDSKCFRPSSHGMIFKLSQEFQTAHRDENITDIPVSVVQCGVWPHGNADTPHIN